MKQVHISDLKKAFARIIEKLESEGVSEIITTQDFYNLIPTDSWEIYRDKPDIVIGSLSDDIDSISELVNNPDRECTYVDFDRVASVLRLISQIQNPPD